MLLFYLSLIDDEVERSTFEEIYNTYRKQMLMTANLILHNHEDSEDVVHDVFYLIATKHMSVIRELTDPNDMRNYLLKATKNTALNELKKRRRSNIPMDAGPERELRSSPDLTDESFIDQICAKADYETVVKALLSLDEPYRDVLYYHFVAELTVNDCAKLLNRNASTAKKQLLRGKKLLLSKLGMKGDEDHVDD